jgi:hypothetical protein
VNWVVAGVLDRKVAVVDVGARVAEVEELRILYDHEIRLDLV